MFTVKLVALLGATATAIDIEPSAGQGDDASLHCLDNTAFCQRTREWKIDQWQNAGESSLGYSILEDSVQVDSQSSQITAKVNLYEGCWDDSGYMAKELDMTLDFYQDGILRVQLDTPDKSRFQISQEDLPVVWDQLKSVQNFDAKVDMVSGDKYAGIKVKDLTRDEGDDEYSYYISYNPLSISQYTNGKLTASTASQPYFESESSTSGGNGDSQCWSSLQDRASKRSGMDIYGQETSDVKQSVSWSFNVYGEEQAIYGIPEREDTLALRYTTGSDPYQMFATDHLHAPGEPGPLYGSVPYIMGLTEESATSLLWVNSAKTTVDLDEMKSEKGSSSQVTFSSEANVMEFFMFASGAKTQDSMNRVKQANKDLATISGFAPMPLLHTLGFHFCKWAPVSADMLMERNRQFTDYGFPIDVLWSDIEWAQQYDDPAGYEYFKFNPANFTDSQISQMNSEIEAAGRRIVVIVDPHIKASDDYFVYSEGMEMQNQEQPADNVSNIFIRAGSEDTTPFYGDCWPGNSAWIDFLNTNAQDFWGSLFDYKVFKGSNYMYSFWNDMNEPAVFSTDSHTMPLDAIHVKADGTKRTHLEVHNAYGALHQRSSYRGLLKRDNNTQRPFVLTRSFFLGSQKFGAYWTGDNRAVFEELQGSISMIMQLGNSGHPFGGSDIPGFYGSPTDDLFVMFYQVGMYYPFFRAHSQDVMLPFPLHDREPWMQTSRVREAIRDSINRRYDLIHYIYTTIERTTNTAEPLMRAMWSEFPDETRFRQVASQFMFGSSLLVAPKVTRPEGVYKHMHMQEVTYALPEGETWYNFYTKEATPSTPQGEWVTAALTDLEQAVFARGGSILPILLHEDCMSLIPCMQNDVRLEVFPAAAGHATGSLYLDDGHSYEFVDRDSKSAKMNFRYESNTLSANVEYGTDYEAIPNVATVVIYGTHNAPAGVTAADGTQLEFVYEASNQACYVRLAEGTRADKVSLTVAF